MSISNRFATIKYLMIIIDRKKLTVFERNIKKFIYSLKFKIKKI